MSRLPALSLATLALFAFTSTAWAAPACTVTATPVSFGNYDHLDLLPNDSSGTLTLECVEAALLTLAATVNYSIALDTGNTVSYTPRELSNGGNTLNYNLYTDIGRSAIWGDGTGGSLTVDDSVLVPGCILTLCASVTANKTVYARIPAAQSVPGGSYSDTITVTVTY